mmetsp:Transcript_27386/g.64183  ORF Transcript_27386/g.64183 Transcript_27386/m.64183 type:complete len:305 (+) Transcript_27386:2928-3842(+)
MAVIPRLVRAGPVHQADPLLLPRPQITRHLDVPAFGQMLKVLPDHQRQWRLRPLQVQAVLPVDLSDPPDHLRHVLLPPPLEVEDVNPGVEADGDVGGILPPPPRQAGDDAVPRHGGDGMLGLVGVRQSVPHQLDHVALHDGIRVDPHGLALLGQQFVDDEAHVVGGVGVEAGVLAVPDEAIVLEFAQVVLFGHLGQLAEMDADRVRQTCQGLVPHKEKLHRTGRVGLHGPDGRRDARARLLIASIDHIIRPRSGGNTGSGCCFVWYPIVFFVSTFATRGTYLIFAVLWCWCCIGGRFIFCCIWL